MKKMHILVLWGCSRINKAWNSHKKSPLERKGLNFCAREESRTPTGVTPQASETCASTNSATRAEVEPLRRTKQRKLLLVSAKVYVIIHSEKAQSVFSESLCNSQNCACTEAWCEACLLLCPGRDSNSYTCYGATPSKWCVYQFRHLGQRWFGGCKSSGF